MPLSFYANRFYRLPMLGNEDAAGGGGASDDNATITDGESKPLGENGESALKAEREARKAADATAKALQAKLDKIDAAQREADEAKAVEDGKYKELLEKRDADLTTTKADLTNATTELESLRSYFSTQYAEALKDLPDVVKAFAPDDDASFDAKSKWLTKAQAEAKKIDKQKPRGGGFDPQPGGNPNINERQEVDKVRQRPAFRSL